MTLAIEKFVRKPFFIEACRVSQANMAEVAAWCGGEVRNIKDPSTDEITETFIKVDVHHPLSDRQTKAFFGDWVLYAGTGFKVYKHKAFLSNFDSADGQRNPETTSNVFESNSDNDPPDFS